MSDRRSIGVLHASRTQRQVVEDVDLAHPILATSLGNEETPDDPPLAFTTVGLSAAGSAAMSIRTIFKTMSRRMVEFVGQASTTSSN